MYFGVSTTPRPIGFRAETPNAPQSFRHALILVSLNHSP